MAPVTGYLQRMAKSVCTEKNFSRVRLAWLLLLLPFFFQPRLYAQGCSDAGLCTLPPFKSNPSLFKNALTLSQNVGFGEANAVSFTYSLEGKFRLSKGPFLHLKIPFAVITGNLGTSRGFGDVNFALTQTLWVGEKGRLNLTLGGKLSADNADKSRDGRPFPMAYQTSQGTDDLLAGISGRFEKWLFAAGYQHPFKRNKNGFLRSRWPGEPDAGLYFESNRLKRGDDLMVRVEKEFTRGQTKLFFGLLPIVRLQKDRIIDGTGADVSLTGSNGLTLNITVGANFPLGRNLNLNVTGGAPVISRDVKADGLQRGGTLLTNLEYEI